ncbi:MAG: hypothetical protein CMJ39_07100 [Phycisphaerae bacterium]|nr:hypothetical protein [Phycisphaerae bacterium]|tara:strand:- start:5061 stop:6068 length:1008 start_codon:yes stop_codon:yes gene_type:complete
MMNHSPGHPDLERLAQLALDGVHRAYPYHLSHVMHGMENIESPSDVNPVFYGCFDWHSAVHGHWLLAYTLRHCVGSRFAQRCQESLEQSFTQEAIEVETEYLQRHPAFERPYGLAWLLMLAAELDQHDLPDARRWRELIRPLEDSAAANLMAWLPKLTHPVRSGTHPQTAFALSLVWDWAQQVNHPDMKSLIMERSSTFYGNDHDYALHLEPSGEDFLSASLGSASLMTRVLDSKDFTRWLDQAMPGLGRDFIFTPATCPDRSDGRLTHLDGLNLSRSWMLQDILHAIDGQDERQQAIHDSMMSHRVAGLDSVTSEHYEGSHWLGTFAAWMHHRS